MTDMNIKLFFQSILLFHFFIFKTYGEVIRETNGIEGMTRRCEDGRCVNGHLIHGFHSFEGNSNWELRTRMGKIVINQVNGYDMCDLYSVSYMRPFKYVNDILEGEMSSGWLGIGLNDESGPFEFSRKDVCQRDDYKTGWTLKDSEIKNYAKTLMYKRGPKFLFNLEHLETKSECFRHVTWYATIARTCNALFHRYDVCDKKWLMIYGMPGKECVHEVEYEIIFDNKRVLVKLDGTEEKRIRLGLVEINLTLRSIISDASPIVGMISNTTSCVKNCSVDEYQDFKEFGTQIEAFLPHAEFGDSCYDGFKPGIQFYHHVSTCEPMNQFLNGLGISDQKTGRRIIYEINKNSYDFMDGFNAVCGDINDKVREKFNEKIHCEKVQGNVRNDRVGSRVEYDVVLFTNASYNVLDEISMVLPSSQEVSVINCTYYQTDGETVLCYSLHSTGGQKNFKLVDGVTGFLIYHSDVDGIECIRFSYFGTYAVEIKRGKRGVKCNVKKQKRITELGEVTVDLELKDSWFNPDGFFSDLASLNVLAYFKSHLIEWLLIIGGIVLMILFCCIYQELFKICKMIFEGCFDCCCGLRRFCDNYYVKYERRRNTKKDGKKINNKSRKSHNEMIELNNVGISKELSKVMPSAPRLGKDDNYESNYKELKSREILEKLRKINEIEKLKRYGCDGKVMIDSNNGDV